MWKQSAFIFPGDFMPSGTQKSTIEAGVFREPIKALLVQLFCSHYTVHSTFTSYWYVKRKKLLCADKVQMSHTRTHPSLTSACLSISCVYCGTSSISSIMVAMVIVSGTDTPAVSSRRRKICSVRSGLMFTMGGLAHTLTSCEGSDWLKMSMTSSASSCRKSML